MYICPCVWESVDEHTQSPSFAGDGSGRDTEKWIWGGIQEAGVGAGWFDVSVSRLFLYWPRLQCLLTLFTLIQEFLPKESLLGDTSKRKKQWELWKTLSIFGAKRENDSSLEISCIWTYCSCEARWWEHNAVGHNIQKVKCWIIWQEKCKPKTSAV